MKPLTQIDAERAARLRAARIAAGYHSAESFIAAHDLVASTYRSTENGTRRLTERKARDYAGLLDVTCEYLMHGVEEPRPLIARAPRAPHNSLIDIEGEEYALIGVFDLRFSAGPGAWVEDDKASPLYYEPHRHNWLRSITSASPASLFAARVDGDSMADTLRSGDQVLIDRTRARATVDGIYVLRRGDDLQIKRIAVDPRSKLLTIISDNPAYPTWSDVDPDTLTIVGRVIWLGRQL